MKLFGFLKDKRHSSFSSLFDERVSVKFKIMTIIAYAAAVGNSIGFLANFILHDMDIPTAFCGFCAMVVLIYLLFILRTKYYLQAGFAILFLLTFAEFPLLVFAYGAVMYPYLVLGFMALMMLISGKLRWISGGILGAYNIAVIVVSLLFSDEMQGVLGTTDPSGLVGSAVVTFIVTLVALTFCMVTWQNVYLKESIETDGITGKHSRIGFFRKAGKLIKNSADGKYSLLCFDVSCFKAVNTVHGAEEGNKVLCFVGDYIENADFSPVLVGRLGGDRFVSLVESAKISKQMLKDFCHLKYENGNKSIDITLSCGVYPINDSGESIDIICDKAVSIIRFIRIGRNNTVAVFNEDMANSFFEETKILEEVEKAITQKSFEPYYQPIVDINTGKIVSAEALARWIHPENGIVSPSVFIPILEKKERISELDNIIISKVNDLVKTRFIDKLPIVPVSVNISRVDLFSVSTMEKINEISREGGGRHGLCRFEITESALISLPEYIVQILSDIRNHGASIMVDDFGSGYSSLGMISQFEFDYIKLDKQFADHIEDSEKNRGIIKSVIELAHNLNSKVVAEGIENEAQLNFLRECGCDYIQGFYFHRPMCEADFVNLLNKEFEREVCLK